MAESAAPDGQEEKQRVAGVFGRAARTYDQSGPRFFARFGKRLAGLAGIEPSQAVLDVACGRGASALPAARLVGPRGRVVGVDLAEGMVEELRSDVRALGVHNLTAEVMDAEDLRFPDDSFDRVLAGFCLFFFPHRERALAEMRRVLKPGGRLVLSTWTKTDTGWRWLDDMVASYLADREGSSPRTVDVDDVTGDPSRMCAILAQAGFAKVHTVTETEELAYATEDDWWASLWTHGRRGALAEIERRLGTAGLARFEAEARGNVRRTRSPSSDCIRQIIPVLYTIAS